MKKDSDEELEQITGLLHQLFVLGEYAIKGKFIFSVREDYSKSVEQSFRKANLPFTKFHIDRLNQEEIIEVVEGLTSTERLKNRYQFEVAPKLPTLIADDLLAEMVATAKQRTEELGKVEGFTEEEKDKLYQMIGLGALKYFLLKVEPKKRLLFDPNESIDFQGNTGPFIQYTHARIQSVLNKANFRANAKTNFSGALTSSERDVLVCLSQYPALLQAAAQEHSPALVANYTYELAKLYNKFYHEEIILKLEDEELKAFRLALSAATAKTIKKAMSLLGIQVPDKM